jgi:hypothetical protein
MQKVERQSQLGQSESQAPTRQRNGIAVSVSQKDRIVETMIEANSTMTAQRKLADKIRSSPRAAMQQKIGDMINNSPRQVTQKRQYDGFRHNPAIVMQPMAAEGSTDTRLINSNSATLKRGGPIQRKVGFEFQAFNSVTFQDGNGLTPLQGSTVGNGAGFYVEGDIGQTINEMEIVTTAVDETPGGRNVLANQMASIQALTNGIVHNAPVNALAAGGVNWLPNIAGYHFDVNGAVHFHPQSTVGVRFDKIAELIDYATSAPSLTGGVPIGGPLVPAHDPKAALAQQIGWSGQLDQQGFKAAWATGLAKARADLAGASDNAISFASILYGFAEVTAMNVVPNDASFAKYFMPFMLRLGLLPHYGALNGADMAALANIRQEVLDSPFLPQQTNDSVNFNPTTIQNLLTALGQGEDLQDLEVIAGYGAYAPGGMPGMANAADIGMDIHGLPRAGAIIELRKLGNDVTPAQLSAFALAVFDLIQLINAPPPHGQGNGNEGQPPEGGGAVAVS